MLFLARKSEPATPDDLPVAADLLDTGAFLPQYWKMGQEGFDGDQYLLPRSADRVLTHINETRFNEVFAGYSEDELPFTPIPGT